ncbi:MAG: glycoside hydrolase family 16 protein [Altererythrobacter sp.]|nr:glycoside hydrolase family 16 protein [Altererythrobacter sp.]
MHRSIVLAVFSMVAGCAAPVDNVDPEWELVWADEFDGDALDRGKWAPEESCWGGGNDERQCYTDRPENIEVSEGLLRLKGRAEQFTGPLRPPEIAEDPNPTRTQNYTSGKIRSKGLAAWKYGRIEVRAKVPAGQGLWPAVWMMPDESAYGPWPLSGEIDILETVNIGAGCDECPGSEVENRTVSALHFGDLPPGNDLVDKKTPLATGKLPSDEFNTYAVEWGEGLIVFFVNGEEHLRATPADWFTGSQLANGNANAPFDQPFYVMANLAVGGKWPERDNEKGLDPDALPAELQIDWIRVYQCAEDRETGRACMTQ